MFNIITNNQDDNIKSFHQAIKDNNYELVAELIKVVDLNSLDEEKCPPLYYAIQNQQWKMVQLLIENGAQLNVDDNDEWCTYARETLHDIIHYAVADPNVEESFIDFLLSQPTINIEQRQSRRSHLTPILTAAVAGNIRILKHLITKYKPNIHVKCNYGENLFHSAMFSSGAYTVELIKYVHSLGVDINIHDRDGCLPLTSAINNDLPFEIIQQLIEHGAMFRVNQNDTSRPPCLSNIIKRDENDYQLFKYVFPMIMKQFPSGDISIKKLLFEAVCNANTTISKYIVANFYLELNNDIIKTTAPQNQSHSTNDQNDERNDLFIALGLNSSFRCDYDEKRKLLQSPKFHNILQLFEYLMENGITKGFFNFKTKYEWYNNYTLLLFIAEQPTTTLRLLQLCIENDADIHAVDYNDYNILHSLCHVKEGTTSEDLITKIDYFISLGVNVNAIGNSQLSTPLHFATDNRVHSSQLVPHLINKHHVDIGLRSKDYNKQLAYHSIRTFQTVKAFVSKSNVNFKYDDGNTHLLILLAVADNFNIETSSNPPIDDDYYKSVMYLIDECGADVNVINNKGDTPLHIILSNICNFKRQPIEIIKRIIELHHSSYINYHDYNNNNPSTPLELAINHHCQSHSNTQTKSKALQTIELLLQHNANPISSKSITNNRRQQTILHYTLKQQQKHNQYNYINNEDTNADDLETIINCCIDSNYIIPQ